MNRKSSLVMLSLVLLGLMLLAACNKETQSTSPTAAETKPVVTAAPVDPATAAAVSGTVRFEGQVPKPAKIDMSQDAACKGTNVAETFVVDDGKMANVFVYVKEGLGGRTFAEPTDKLMIHQQDCRYHPHVLGIMVGQTVQIMNNDATTHNIHPTPKDNREWNESQAPNAPAIEKSFAREEIMLPVKCNQHPWMKMYVNVVKSPYFAVTDKDGKFEIKNLPPGDYTLAFVHEKLGEQTQKITLAAKDSKTVDQSFKQ